MAPKFVAGVEVYACPATYRAVLDLLRGLPPGRALDLACGQGALTRLLAGLGHEVTPCDLDPANFRAEGAPADARDAVGSPSPQPSPGGRGSRTGPACVRCDLNERLPFPDGAFDYAVSIESIEHLRDPFGFIAECYRVLAPGGRLVLTTPNLLNLPSRLKFFLSGFHSLVRRPLNEFEPNPLRDHVMPLTYYQLRYMLHRQGFRETDVTTDRRRRGGFFLIWLWPLVAALTRRTMRKEIDPRQVEANRRIRRRLLSADLLLGRTLIVAAEKPAPSAGPAAENSSVSHEFYQAGRPASAKVVQNLRRGDTPLVPPGFGSRAAP